MRIPVASLLVLLAARAGRPPARAAAGPPPEPAAAPVEGCAPVLVADRLGFEPGPPSIVASGTGRRLVARGGRVHRGDDAARHVFGARVVALTTDGSVVQGITGDGAVFAFARLDQAPRRAADLGGSAHPIRRAPPGELIVRDDDPFGTLRAVGPSGVAQDVLGLPRGVVEDAVFLDRRRAVVRFAGGRVGILDRVRGSLSMVETEQPVRGLALEADGVYGVFAPERRTDFTRPPVERRVRLASAAFDAGEIDPPIYESPGCHEVRLGPECALEVCNGGHLFLTCEGGVRTEVEGGPVPEGYGWVHVIPFGDDRRFLIDVGTLHLATRNQDGVSFRTIEPPRSWSREVASVGGEWMHLPSTRDHHAPGETDALRSRRRALRVSSAPTRVPAPRAVPAPGGLRPRGVRRLLARS